MCSGVMKVNQWRIQEHYDDSVTETGKKLGVLRDFFSLCEGQTNQPPPHETMQLPENDRCNATLRVYLLIHRFAARSQGITRCLNS